MTSLQASLMEADRQIDHEGRVWQTLRRITTELRRLNIPHAIVGGICLQHFGIQRSTQDVDILVTREGLSELHAELVGRGYGLKSAGSRHLRDDTTRVRVEFLVTGEFPGDGLPKPLAFPMPEKVCHLSDEGIAFANLETLIELKLASAKSAPHRIKDRADVLELIHALHLPVDFADRLQPYVQNEFRDLAALPAPNDRD